MSTKLTIVEGNSNDKDNVRVIMVKGEKGYSAYDLYVQHGGTHTEAQWLDEFLNAENYYNKSEVSAIFNNVADMKAYNLKNGDTAITLGYYSVNDGGGAKYKITNIQNAAEHQEELNNGLYATLIHIPNFLNVKQIGCKTDDNTFDNSLLINSAIEKLGARSKLFFPMGEYFINNPIVISENFIIIEGENERTRITKTSANGIDKIIETSNNTTYNLNNYDMCFYIGKATSSSDTVSKVKIKNISIKGYDSTETSHNILIIGCGYFKTENVQLLDYNKGILIDDSFACNLDSITALTFGTNRSAIEILNSTAIYITNSYLNARYYAINASNSRIYVNNVACDGHGIVWYLHDNTYASITNSRTETYASILSATTNTQCNISNCDLEFHKPSGSENSYGIRCAASSAVNIKNSLIRYNNYTEDANPDNIVLFNNSASLINCEAYLNLLSIPMNNTLTNNGSTYYVDLNKDGITGTVTPETGITITNKQVYQKDGYVNIYLAGNTSEDMPINSAIDIAAITGVDFPSFAIRNICNTAQSSLYTATNPCYCAINTAGKVSVYTKTENQRYFNINLRYKI